LGITVETAQQIVEDPSFDISEAVASLLPPVLKQLVISRDFIERRENCQVETFYVSGELSCAGAVLNEMKQSLGTEISAWDPLARIDCNNIELPQNEHWRFAVSAGSALASLEVV
jgi:hypothetical protein